MRFASPRDTVAGALFMAIGAVALLLMRHLPMGSSMRMGAGYFPSLVSWILIGFGLVIFARSWWLAGPALERWSLRPVVFVLLAVATFRFGIEPLGLFATIVLVVLVGSLAAKDSRPLEVLIIALALAGFATLLFIELLGLPLNTWPTIPVR